MLVMKFGGSSLGSADMMEKAADIVNNRMYSLPAVVVSAIGKHAPLYDKKVTDVLEACAIAAYNGKDYREHLDYVVRRHEEMIDELDIKYNPKKEFKQLRSALSKGDSNPKRFLDYAMSFGEILSSKIFAAVLNKRDLGALPIGVAELGFVTDANFGEAEALPETYERIRKNLQHMMILPVIPGFVGMTESGEVTTLGRGGSDYTAAVVGAALSAEEIDIWTDVPGIMTADPKIVKDARTLGRISFEEAQELAYFGARVIHPKTIEPAMEKSIPVRILNTFKPEYGGTTIVKEEKKIDYENPVKAIAHKDDICVVKLHSTKMLDQAGYLTKVFEVFGNYQKSVDMISTSEVSVSLTVDNGPGLEAIQAELEKYADVYCSKGKSSINVVGDGIKYTKGIASRIFSTLAKEDINIEMISQGASEISLGLVIDQAYLEKAVNVLHKEFFPESLK